MLRQQRSTSHSIRFARVPQPAQHAMLAHSSPVPEIGSMFSLPSRAAAVLAAVALSAAAVQTAHSQSYPAHPPKIIVPFGVGGPADIYGRMVAQGLSEALGQQFIIENRPGAGSVPGTDSVAKAPPDGYTLVVISNTQAINETLYPHLP